MITVAGSINLDLIARVERLPMPGETVAGTTFDTAPGGKGANQALAACRAGADVAMVGAIANDDNGRAATMLLKAEGVDLEGVQRIEPSQTSTGVALITVDDGSGENQIAVVPGANGSLGDGFGDELNLTSGDTVLFQMEIPVAANRAALARVNEAGARAIINIAPYGDHAPELAAMADITIANETEFDFLADAMGLAGNDRKERAAAFHEKTGKTIVVTLGADGAFAVDADGLTSSSAPRVEAVDTVGAGDTFCGYFATALAESLALADALSLACHAGALACTNKGAQPAIPRRTEVDAMIVGAQ